MEGKALGTGFPSGTGVPLPSHQQMTTWWAVSPSSLRKGRWFFLKHLYWCFICGLNSSDYYTLTETTEPTSAGCYQRIHCRWAKQVLQPGEVPWYCPVMEWTVLGSWLDLILKTFSSCNDPVIQWWIFGSAGQSCLHGWKCTTPIALLVWWMGFPGAQINGGVEEKRKTADECLKGSVMDHVFLRYLCVNVLAKQSLLQPCLPLPFSRRGLFMTHLNESYLMVKNCLIFDAHISKAFFVFFF